MGRNTMNVRLLLAGIMALAALISLHCDHATTPRSPSNLQRITEALQNPSSAAILVAAHRGAHNHAPENSLAAFQEAINLGADIIETDVRQTSDGELVVMHDDQVDRTTNGRGKLADKTLAEIKQLSLNNDHGVPTLAETLELVRGRIFLDLDVKSASVTRIIHLLQQTGTQKQVLLFGSVTKLDSIAAMDSTLLIMPRAKNAAELIKLWQRFHPAVLHADASFMTPLEVAFLANHNTHLWLNALLWPDIKAILGLAAWGYNPLLHSGATIIQTDRPQQLLDYLRENKKHW
jgi:glycerophosphoryl diester phosphodiesterase